MGDQDVLNVALNVHSAFGRADWGAFAANMTPDTILESPVMQGRGPEQILPYFQGVKSAFPDMEGHVVNAVANGNIAAIELRSEGNHTQPMYTPRGNIPATGKHVVIRMTFFYEIVDGKIVSMREYFDPAGFMAQLGVTPAPAGAQA